MDLKCEFIFPQAQAETEGTAKELTVGEVFYAGCTAPEKINATNFTLKLDEKQKYTLKLLGSENQDNKWVFKFTSYQVGAHQFPQVELVKVTTAAPETKPETNTADGASASAVPGSVTVAEADKLNLGPLNFKVASILNPQEKTEPFGPFAGITMGIPFLYWLILLFAILTVISSISGYFLVRWKRKKMLARLEEFEIATSPLQQFYSTYRKLQREHAFFHLKENDIDKDKSVYPVVLNEMEQALKLFLLRKFKTPAIENKWNYTLKDISRYHTEFMSFQYADLKEIIKELEKAKAAVDNLKPKDLIQIFEKMRLFIEFSDLLQDAILRNDKVYLKKMRSLKV